MGWLLEVAERGLGKVRLLGRSGLETTEARVGGTLIELGLHGLGLLLLLHPHLLVLLGLHLLLLLLLESKRLETFRRLSWLGLGHRGLLRLRQHVE